jgi:mono/diheme cytochrome c family protein
MVIYMARDRSVGRIIFERPTMRPRLARLMLIIVAMLAFDLRAEASDSGQLRKRGRLLLEQNCGRCHAVGPTGRSPMVKATPTREIYAKFLPRELQAELSEGMVSKHRKMPQIDFRDEDVDAILAYLYALAIRK